MYVKCFKIRSLKIHIKKSGWTQFWVWKRNKRRHICRIVRTGSIVSHVRYFDWYLVVWLFLRYTILLRAPHLLIFKQTTIPISKRDVFLCIGICRDDTICHPILLPMLTSRDSILGNGTKKSEKRKRKMHGKSRWNLIITDSVVHHKDRDWGLSKRIRIWICVRLY